MRVNVNLHHVSSTILTLVLLFSFDNIGFSQEVCPTIRNHVTPLYTNGSRTANSNEPAIVLFGDTQRGQGQPKEEVAHVGEVGATWGLAWHAPSKKLYAAAFLKRHVDLAPDGLGAIYEIDLSTPTTAGAGNPTLWMNLNSTTYLGGTSSTFPSETAANRGLGAKGAPSNDAWAFPRVGKEGLGDIEFSEDFSRLYAMDLTNKQLLIIDYATKTVTHRIAVPNPGCAGGSNDVRPFGIKEHDGNLYIGIVCSGQTRALDSDMAAYVYRLNSLATPANFLLEVNLNLTSTKQTNRWWHWTDIFGGPGYVDPPYFFFRASPLISDIEFDNAGNMVVGYMDRTAHQLGHNNFSPTGNTPNVGIIANGDVQKVTRSGGSWSPEVAPWTFYQMTSSTPGTDPEDSYLGGLVINDCSGTEYATANMSDPFTTVSNGTIWMTNSSGTQQGGSNAAGRLELIPQLDAPDNFGKAAGLGDLVVLMDPLAVCSLTDAGESNEACNNNGSNIDGSDDYITFDLNPSGSDLGSGYTVSVDNGGSVTPNSGNYNNSTSFRLQDGSANGTLYTITIQDNDDPSCTISTTFQQNSCSNGTPCSLTNAGKSNETCNNNQSPADPIDDYITFDLNPSGTGLGSGYSVSVDNAATISPTSSNYGIPTTFQLQGGSANGTLYTITIQDADDPNCTLTTTVQQNACSNCPDPNCLNVRVNIVDN